MKLSSTSFIATALVALLTSPLRAENLSCGIGPRIAQPIGDFANLAGFGIGFGVNCRKSFKGLPTAISIGQLKFATQNIGAIQSKTRTIYVNIGPRYYLKSEKPLKLYGKIDLSRHLFSTKSEFGGQQNSAEAGSNKLFVGIGFEIGSLGTEAEYDLAGEWLGINLYYSVGGDN